MGTGNSEGRGSPDRVWSTELREAFLDLLATTGNAAESARRLGHRHLFNNRMRRDPDFRRDCEAAMEAAERFLSDWSTPFLGPPEVKSMPSGDEPPGPGGSPEPMIRRTSNGRLQISYVHEGEMSSADEAEFLDLLRTTGQFVASALAVGFSPTTFTGVSANGRLSPGNANRRGTKRTSSWNISWSLRPTP